MDGNKRIGIVSMYHNSRNMGGLLQAYALCRFLNQQGYEAKQLDLPAVIQEQTNIERYRKNLRVYIRKLPSWLGQKALNAAFRHCKRSAYGSIEKSRQTVDQFRKTMIPNDDGIGSVQELVRCNDRYDAFICGSDQIWNPYAFRDEYFLLFADKSKTRLSYAASIAKARIPDAELARIRNSLHNLEAVSVREQTAKEMLLKAGVPDVRVDLDPTMLLDVSHWDHAAVAPSIEKSYLFYYILENDPQKLRAARKLARRLHLRLVMIPCVDGQAHACDFDGRYTPYVIKNPFEFVGLIRDSELVITDSFHATVFSCLFEKKLLCVECLSTGTLLPRVRELLKMFHRLDSYVENVRQLDDSVLFRRVEAPSAAFEEHRQSSQAYLIRRLEGLV